MCPQRLRSMGVRSNRRSAARHRQTKIIVVVSPKGGSGKTAVSSNLAVALAQRHPGRVVAVDLDVQFGDLTLALSLDPEHTFAQLARANQIDATTRQAASDPGRRLAVRARRRRDPVDADSIGHVHVSQVLPLLAQSFDYRDCRHAGRPRRTHAGRPGMRNRPADGVEPRRHEHPQPPQGGRRSRPHGISAERRLVLNRADSKVGLDPSDAEEAMGMRIACSIPSSREIPLSLNFGRPVVISKPKSTVAETTPTVVSALLEESMRLRHEGMAAMSISERISEAQQAARSARRRRHHWRDAPAKPAGTDGAGGLQGQGARGTLRAARHPPLRGDEAKRDAVARHGGNRRH